MKNDPIHVDFTSFDLNYTDSIPDHYPYLPIAALGLQPAAYAQVYASNIHVAVVIPVMADQTFELPACLDMSTYSLHETGDTVFTFKCILEVNRYHANEEPTRLALIRFSAFSPQNIANDDQVYINVEIVQPGKKPRGNVGKVVMDANVMPTHPDH
jgi:hypothetical protein